MSVSSRRMSRSTAGARQTLIPVRHCLSYIFLGSGSSGLEIPPPQFLQQVLGVEVQGDFEELFLLPAVDGQHAVRRQFGNGLTIVIVHFIDTLRLGVPGRYHQDGFIPGAPPGNNAVFCCIGKVFRDYVHCPLQGSLDSRDFFINVLLCLQYRICLTGQQNFCQGFQAGIPGLAAPGIALGLVGPVYILNLLQLCIP